MTAMALVVALCAPQLSRAVVVLSPASASGIYEQVSAAFGPPPTKAGVTANVTAAVPAHGCTLDGAHAAALKGNIALVMRGDCDFVSKVRNAQKAGAVAVVVANNAGDELFKMFSSDTDTSDLKVPAVFVGQTTGKVLAPVHEGGAAVYAAVNTTGEHTFQEQGWAHPYFFMAIILLGLSLTLACTLAATLAGYCAMAVVRRRQRGECLRAVSRLKTHRYRADALVEPISCCICLDDLCEGDSCKELPCKHLFHAQCIDPWLLEKSSLCPLCKASIVGEGRDLHALPQPPDEAREPLVGPVDVIDEEQTRAAVR